MIRPAVGFIAGDPCAGPGLAQIFGDAACLTGIVTEPASPPPDECCLTAIITERVTGDEACLTGITQVSQPWGLRIVNGANVPAALGNKVTHKETTF